jgi:RNA polymerase sigma-70 factor (ECF subfamily)
MDSIVKNYKGMVTKIGFDFRISGHDLDDFIQVVFIKVSKNLDRYNGDLASIGTWIKRIAENTAIDFKRKQERRNLRFVRINEGAFESLNILDNAFVFEFFDTSKQSISDLLNYLSIKEKQVITLKYFENYTQQQIEGELGLSKNSGGVYLSRAMDKLKTIFDKRGLKRENFC